MHRAFLGNHPSFSAAGFVLISPYELILYAILGVIAAVWATGFVRMLYFFEDRFEEFKIPPWVKGAAGFGLVGVIGIWVPQVFGVGYVSIQQVLDQHVGIVRALALAVAKPLATSLTLGSGGSGGIFAPSLFTGAFLGDAFGRVVHLAFPAWTAPGAAYGLVGMAALFAAAAEAPMTAILIVFEMSNDYTIILPLMVCVVIATVLGRRMIGSTVYEMKLIRRGIDWQRVRRPRFLSRVSIGTIRRWPPVVAQLIDEISSIVERYAESGELAVPVCSGQRFIGIVTSADLAQAVAQGHGSEKISTIVQTLNFVLHPDDTVERAATLMADAPVPLLPVVDPRDEHLLGIVTRRDVLQAYRSLVDA